LQYNPDWRKIIFLSAVFHAVIIFASAIIFFTSPVENAEENLLEIEWVELPAEKNFSVDDTEISETDEKSFASEFPLIEMPPILEPAVKENLIAKIPETAEQKSSQENITDNKKTAENSPNKIKVLMKVYPKDIFAQLISVGILKERPVLNGGKIVVSVAVGLDGKMKNVKILQGGGSDEKGAMLNIISEAAASGWVFEPFTDENGNQAEIKTQIEFTPEDF